MLIVTVSVRVKPDAVEQFRAASLENAKQSIREPGIARFDHHQRQQRGFRQYGDDLGAEMEASSA